MDEIAATALEALLRQTLGDLFDRALGPDWHDSLSASVRRTLERTREVASGSRDGVPSEPWQSAGLREIREVAVSFARGVYEGRKDYSSVDREGLLATCFRDFGWDTVAQCTADFERLMADRHDEAHPDVVSPPASARRDEVEAIRRRLRLGCEQVRRRLMDGDEAWFPYIERIDCPGVAVWTYLRGQIQPAMASLVEHDQIEFVVSAVNTNGSSERLQYGISVQPDGGSFVTLVQNDVAGRLRCVASPAGRNVMFRVTVRELAGGHDASGWDDEVVFTARVKPMNQLAGRRAL